MEIIHLSAECYPVAKAGGLGDVVGALPKYQCKAGHFSKVVMPMYRTKFLYENNFVVDYKGRANLGDWYFNFTIIKETTNKLGFDLYLVDINGLLDTEKIYGYDNDSERFISFQIAVAHWIYSWEHLPDVVHCHDHHTALLPFMMQNCFAFRDRLAGVKTILTIHNAQYQGWLGWDKRNWLPAFDSWKWGQLDWADMINPLASGIKCAWKVTTVSHSYLHELRSNSNGLEDLFEYERGKCYGILNGIDVEVWNPKTDKLIPHHYSFKTVTKGKQKNKEALCKEFNLNAELPMIVFIGRLVGEKAADILPEAIQSIFYSYYGQVSVFIVGSGDPNVEWQLNAMNGQYGEYYHCAIGYNEVLAHKLYAAADFLLMPSRVEPCGLNQMFSMRYGTVPMVRSTGGLQDTVKDMGEWQGFGIRFNHATVGDIHYSVSRAINVFKENKFFEQMRKQMMQIDHSWEKTIDEYDKVYG